MKIYFSGAQSSGIIGTELLKRNVPVLFTHAYPKELHKYLEMADATGIRCDVMVDSGAFTAWNKGKPVTLDQLMDFHKEVLDTYGDKHDFVFIALDIIPGERGRMPTEQDVIEAMRESYDNFLYMQERTPRPILPVYHSGEPQEYRDKLLQHTNYICLSMNQNMSEKNRIRWAAEAQVEGVQMHGLAATGRRMVKYVDWHTVDSAGWCKKAGMGIILLPTTNGYTEVFAAFDSPYKKQRGKHIDNRHDVQYIEDIMRSQGYEPDDIRNGYESRCIWNVDQYLNLKINKLVTYEKGLFDL